MVNPRCMHQANARSTMSTPLTSKQATLRLSIRCNWKTSKSSKLPFTQSHVRPRRTSTTVVLIGSIRHRAESLLTNVSVVISLTICFRMTYRRERACDSEHHLPEKSFAAEEVGHSVGFSRPLSGLARARVFETKQERRRLVAERLVRPPDALTKHHARDGDGGDYARHELDAESNS